MKEKPFYPAIFHKVEQGYRVSFPDVPEALTEGGNMQESYKMAVDCLGLARSVDRIHFHIKRIYRMSYQ